MIKIKKGLDLPLAGEPVQSIEIGNQVPKVALIGPDYIGMRPTMQVSEGDRVKLGQPLFEDKKTLGVTYTSPGCGTVVGVNRGEKRAFQSIEVELDGDEQIEFSQYPTGDFPGLTREQVRDNLTASGLWTALRMRPFSKVPDPNSAPHSIFVTAIDTNPHAPDVNLIIGEKEGQFENGLQILRHLTDGPVYLCKGPKGMLPGQQLDFVKVAIFEGPHPAGLPGTHIHFLDPVGPNKTVWHIGYQDVIAIGHLFETGQLSTERVISLAGPTVNNPRLIRTRIGADLNAIVDGELEDVENRLISGSVLSGRHAAQPFNYLGRYHNQVSALQEGRQRDFLGWQSPGFFKFSVKKVFASAAMPWQKFKMTTSTEGSKRAMVPIGSYEQVMPLDIIPTFLLRSLITGDTEQAQQLGALELDEEDVALCTFVCPGKYDYGPILRKNLTSIELEG